MTQSGGAGGLQGDDTTSDEGQGHAHNNQTDHAEGGLVGNNDINDDDDDGHSNNDGNDDDVRCGGRDGHHRMRKGRGHDNRTNTTIKYITEEGRGDGSDGSDDDDDDNDDDDERVIFKQSLSYQ